MGMLALTWVGFQHDCQHHEKQLPIHVMQLRFHAFALMALYNMHGAKDEAAQCTVFLLIMRITVFQAQHGNCLL